MSEQQQYGSHVSHSPNGGGNGQSFSNVAGADRHGQNFLSHLLGLDHDAHISTPHGSTSFQANAQGHALQAPGNSTNWTRALSAVKLSDVLQGVRVTPNMLFMMLYASFVCWLFVIYWIRHHEPLANSVLGTNAPGCATAAADRRILAGTKLAFPGRTSSQTGDIYVPSGESSSAGSSTLNQSDYYLHAAVPLPAPPIQPTPPSEPQPLPLSQRTAYCPPVQPYATTSGQPGAFMVPEAEATGARVKMIVNR